MTEGSIAKPRPCLQESQCGRECGLREDEGVARLLSPPRAAVSWVGTGEQIPMVAWADALLASPSLSVSASGPSCLCGSSLLLSKSASLSRCLILFLVSEISELRSTWRPPPETQPSEICSPQGQSHKVPATGAGPGQVIRPAGRGPCEESAIFLSDRGTSPETRAPLVAQAAAMHGCTCRKWSPRPSAGMCHVTELFLGRLNIHVYTRR